ncbi:MAG: hypothetical protein IPO87_11555 [Flavobacteriales bacterium]|nr:hypothetical protein [Flavobacteriales bacterium]
MCFSHGRWLAQETTSRQLPLDLMEGFRFAGRSVTHSGGTSPSLWITGELHAWLSARLVKEGIPVAELQTASLDVDFRTDRIATDKKKIVSFDFQCHSVLETSEKKVGGPERTMAYATTASSTDVTAGSGSARSARG